MARFVDYLTVTDIAKMLGWARSTVYEVMRSRDDFPGAMVVSKRRYYLKSEVKKWLDKVMSERRVYERFLEDKHNRAGLL